MDPLGSDFWVDEAAMLYSLVFEIVDEAAAAGVYFAVKDVLQQLLGVRVPEVDYDLLNERAHAFARAHSFSLVRSVTETSQRALQEAFGQWIASGEPLPALIAQIEPLFGPVRAEMIAVTEITRVYAESNIIGWREVGVDGMRFQTAVDDVVCEKCAPFHGQEYELGDVEHTPPIHVRCRCYLQPIVRIPEWVN